MADSSSYESASLFFFSVSEDSLEDFVYWIDWQGNYMIDWGGNYVGFWS